MKIFKCICLLYAACFCVTSDAFGNNITIRSGRRRRNLDFITVCYHGLGCFYTGPPFFNIPFRMLSLPPLPQKLIRTTYNLYTRKNRNNPFSFSPASLQSLLQSEFNPSSWTRIVVHGFFDGSYLTSWLFNMKDDFLRLADDNVIIVDHSTTAQVPRLLYQQSVADTRVIGVQVENLITFLSEKFGADVRKFHIIGHSLGAEVAGYAGERLKNLGRITALDPAGPYFRKSPRIVQLDDTDATFVDVIHSNPAPNILLGLGTPEDLGHINFWPNGGFQRGCPLTVLRTLFNGVRLTEPVLTFFTCRHTRSYEFFLYSFNQNDCLYVGAECPSYADFLEGKCDCGQDGDKCEIMGVFSTPKPLPRRRYYLKVGDERPYCLHQYQVTVYIQTKGDITKSVSSNVQLKIYGKVEIQEHLKLNIDLRIQKQVNTFLIFSPQKVGTILYTEMSSFGGIFDQTKVSVEAVKINYLFPAPRNDTEIKLCRQSFKGNGFKKQVKFSKEDCN